MIDRELTARRQRRDQPPRAGRWVLFAAAVVLFIGAVALLPGESGDERGAGRVGVTIGAAEARSAVDRLVGLLNGGEVEAAFGRLAALRNQPEAIQGLTAGPMLDFDQELEYAAWNAALGGRRVIRSCSIEPWTHLVDGVRRAENALVLYCAGTFTNRFFSATGTPDLPLGLAVAVDFEGRILLYQEAVVDGSDFRRYLELRSWLRREHPGEAELVFTPGGTPRPTAESAALVLLRAAAFSESREDRVG